MLLLLLLLLRCWLAPVPPVEWAVKASLVQIMHEIGFGMDVSYGYADKKIMRTIEEGAKE